MSLGINIRKLRKLNNMTQEELAQKIGVSSKTISSWEVDRTEPDMGMIEKLAEYFGCEKSNLVGDVKPDYYYLNEEVRQLAQDLFDRYDLRILFDTTKKVKKEDIKIIQDMVNRLVGE